MICEKCGKTARYIIKHKEKRQKLFIDRYLCGRCYQKFLTFFFEEVKK